MIRYGRPSSLRRAIEIAGFERRAHERAADALAVDLERRHFLDREAEPLSGGAQARDGALARARIVKVVTDDDVAHAEPRVSRSSSKLRALIAAQLRVEMQHSHAIDAVPGERLELLAQARQPRRRSAPSKYSRGVGSKVTTVAGSAELERPAPHRGEHVLVTAVHAVVVADRQHAAAMTRPQVVETADQFHRLAPRAPDGGAERCPVHRADRARPQAEQPAACRSR